MAIFALAAYLAGPDLMVYEQGINRGTFGTLAVGDIVRVSIESGVVKYYRNGALVYTSTRTPTSASRVTPSPIAADSSNR